MKTRNQIIEEAWRIRQECEQILLDVAHWNNNVRKVHEEHIDADPDGQLVATINAIDAALVKERALWVKNVAVLIAEMNGKTSTNFLEYMDAAEAVAQNSWDQDIPGCDEFISIADYSENQF